MAHDDERKTGTRVSGSELRRDRSPRWRPHGCAECPPSLRWRPSVPDHVFGDGRLGDLEPKPEQFTMNARGTPQGFSVLIRRTRSRSSRPQITGKPNAVKSVLAT